MHLREDRDERSRCSRPVIVGLSLALLSACGPAAEFSSTPPVATERYAAAPNRLRTVYSFCKTKSDGSTPEVSLIGINGIIYGTTYAGGKFGEGTVFAIDPATDTERVLHDFAAADGEHPMAALLEHDGTLYGTTSAGGSYGGGTVFGMSLDRASLQVLHSFGNGADGSGPQAALIEVDGALYGTTAGGGEYGSGTAFRMSLDGASEQVLHSFGNGSDGADPRAALVNLDGTLYGTTASGGTSFRRDGHPHRDGTVYSLSTDGEERVLHSFGRRLGRRDFDARYPEGSLKALRGTLYGTTIEGGPKINARTKGTVFSISTTGTETVLYAFRGNRNHADDGEYPEANLIEVHGALYGTTYAGGLYGDGSGGTVFEITTGGIETALHSFDAFGGGGYAPDGGLLGIKRILYGTTSAGGAHHCGTVFALHL